MFNKIEKQARKNEDIFWEKPDAISGNYETRKMVMRKGQHHPSTHFYEFYWAHHMREQAKRLFCCARRPYQVLGFR